MQKQLVLIPDGQHNTTWLSQNYGYHIRQFLTEVNDCIELFSSSLFCSLVFNNVEHELNNIQYHLSVLLNDIEKENKKTKAKIFQTIHSISYRCI